jgi:hypothetical protein
MQRLLNGLLDSKGRIAEEVHAIRKLGKSLRGGFSLFRLKESAIEIQAIGRLLSGPRDAVSRLKTWEKLGWQGDPLVVSAIHGLLEQQTHSAARRPPPEAVAWCVERVAEARKGLTDLPAADLEAVLASGLKKLAKRVRKRFKKLDRGGLEDFHDARKALKAFLGAHGFLPEGAVALDPGVAEIADLLGDENDIATLSAWLVDHGFTRKFAPGLWELLEDRRGKLQQRVIAEAVCLISPR